MIYLIIVDVLW